MIYAIIPLHDSSTDFAQRLKDLGLKAYSKYAPRLYLVSYDGTSGDLAEAVGFSKQAEKPETGIVLKVGYYYGYASGSMWEWLDSRENG